MSGLRIKFAVRRLAGLALAAAFAVCAAPAMGQTATVGYPPSRALGDIAAWLQRDTPIGPAQVVDVSPSAVTAVTSAAPMGETRGFLANVSSEAMDPDILNRDGIASWSIPIEVDCERRIVRLGAMTGYPLRDLRTDPRVVRAADTGWVNPTPTAPLGAVLRALCDRDFQRPLMGRTKTAAPPAAKFDAPRPAPKPAPPPPAAPAPPAAAKPKPKPAPGGGAFAVQIGASPSLPDIQTELVRFKKKFGADLDGLNPGVATVQVDGKTVNRALISGFGSASDANAFCKKLAAAGQACFVRR